MVSYGGRTPSREEYITLLKHRRWEYYETMGFVQFAKKTMPWNKNVSRKKTHLMSWYDDSPGSYTGRDEFRRVLSAIREQEKSTFFYIIKKLGGG